MKITVVGGGSTYTPELADGLGRLAPWVTELVLVDPDQTRLDAVGPVSARIMRRHGHPAVVRWTDNLDDALDGAAAVLIQLRVGGQAARNRDETWPLDYDCVGQETTGAGGLAKALRTVPLVLDIAEQARRRALPGAWIVDFTNPVGIVTRALLDAGHRAVGLCNVAIGLQRYFASVLGTDPARVSLDHAGLNHLTWLRGVQVDGKEVLPELLAAHGEEIADHAGMPLSVLHDLGVVPSYYLRYFYFHDEVVGEERQRPSRAAEVAAIERELMELYADPDLDTKPELLSKRGGAFYSEAAVALIASLFGDDPGVKRRGAGRQRAQLRHAAVPGRRRGDRGAGHDQRRRARAGAGRADRAAVPRADRARVGLRGAGPRRRAAGRPLARRRGAARAPARRAVRRGRPDGRPADGRERAVPFLGLKPQPKPEGGSTRCAASESRLPH